MCRSFRSPRSGAINKTFGALIAGLLGALAGGWVVTRMRLFPALLLLGVAQALVNLLYIWLVGSGPDIYAMATVVPVEKLLQRVGQHRVRGVGDRVVQHAFLGDPVRAAVVAVGGRSGVPWAGGGMAGAAGGMVDVFFVITALSAIPGLLLLVIVLLAARSIASNWQSRS